MNTPIKNVTEFTNLKKTKVSDHAELFNKLKSGEYFEHEGQIMKKVDVKMTPHLQNGIYTLEIEIPQDGFVKQHSHQYAHTSILAEGTVELVADGERTIHTAPAVLNIPENVMHEIYAKTPAVWYCIHRTDETDINKVEDSLTKK